VSDVLVLHTNVLSRSRGDGNHKSREIDFFQSNRKAIHAHSRHRLLCNEVKEVRCSGNVVVDVLRDLDTVGCVYDCVFPHVVAVGVVIENVDGAWAVIKAGGEHVRA